ncbi:adult-specific rigid cuticular protein 11.9 [Caerostris darwini]|uniref:Adult-specific rigid cuticular protein 11.9 n=1 Tax=Caerostris darwini TaxID=1538125 RepID=A0AAV4PE00_9ARAC|nr:adult-specific rigid cuticular protein 11.9 [Caerostris darwini]
MKFLVLSLLFAVAMSAEMGMNQAGDSYNFHYAAGDAGAHQRAESGHGSTVSGSYSYIDPNGNLRSVSYTAGPDGFKPTGDIGVDKKTAADAAAIAALAPKAPEVPVAHGLPYVPVHHWAPFYHGAAWHHAAPHYNHWGAFW